ncbi:hypothetical protein CPC08DRAFT_260019 [Agrocybe pediades]|nr:hypothetical protein CPC08DRAFT_260019 [Agrocybe pediades]
MGKTARKIKDDQIKQRKCKHKTLHRQNTRKLALMPKGMNKDRRNAHLLHPHPPLQHHHSPLHQCRCPQPPVHPSSSPPTHTLPSKFPLYTPHTLQRRKRKHKHTFTLPQRWRCR